LKLVDPIDKVGRLREFQDRLEGFIVDYADPDFMRNRTKTITDFVFEVLESPEINELLLYNYPFEVYTTMYPLTGSGYTTGGVYAQISEGALGFFSLYENPHGEIVINNVPREKIGELVDRSCKTVLETMQKRLDTIIREEV